MAYKAKVNGIERQYKNRVALEIIKQFIEKNKNKSYEDLQEIFAKSNFSSSKIIIDESEKNLFISKKGEKEFKRRYFTSKNEIVYIQNKTCYITSEWGVDTAGRGRYFDALLIFAENNNIIVSGNELKISKITALNQSISIKNIMLYGAPGVGKTHNYKKLISMIEEGKTEQDIFKSISDNKNVSNEYDETFQNIKDDKRIEFVTFHQSYSYEDFIEGFRPSEDVNAIIRKDGIFKAIAEKAQRNLDESKKDINTIKEEKTFFELFTLFKDFIQDEIDRNQKFIINDTAYISNIEDDAFRYTGDNWGNSQRMKFSDIELLNELNIAERKDIKKTDGVSGLANQHATYFSYFMHKFNEFKKKQNIIVDNVTREKLKNFYIVIDEINRGNISKIFGELITLIEEDKRDTYEVTLPYSKEKFKIPSNLYIIATMNSTDKSIATIDIALRRRFTFLKMKPNLDLVKNEKAKQLMKNLNVFIETTLNKDYMIGHAYFMSELDLEFIKEYKIKPLLEEYFYGDKENYKKALDILEEKN